jgi:hypothetical protein
MSIIRILDLEVSAFVYALIFIVGYGLLTSRINTQGLLLDKLGSGGTRPERVQLLLATIALSVKYISDVARANNGAFPSLGSGWLYLFGSSSGIYLARKLYERLSAGMNPQN